MSEFFSVPVELLCHVYTSLANHLTKHMELKHTEKDDASTDENMVLHDSKDTIFQEFENPRHSNDPSAWKRNVPSIKVSLRNSAYFAFLVTVIAGGLVGIASLLFMCFIIRFVYTCDWKPLTDPTYPLHLKRRRIIGESFQSFLLYFWQPALMCMVFKWNFLRDVNLFTCTLIGASIDLGYRHFLSLYDLYYPPWVPYPLNVVYIAVILTTSFSISRKFFKTNRFRATVLAFKLSSQFITGAILLYILWYALLSRFAQEEGFLKIVYLALVFSIALFPKVIARQCVLRLNRVNHPGTSYALVSTAYGSANIVYRLLQAEFKSILAYTALSIGYGVIHLTYDLINIFRDHYKEKRQKMKLESDYLGRSSAARMTSPRSQRLAADLAIQEMMFSSTALVLSVGIMFVYGFIHCSVSIVGFQQMVGELVAKIFLGLFIEFLFNIVTVMLLTRKRNVPVLAVWNCKWMSHVTVCVIAVTMIVSYSMDKLLEIVREHVVKGPEVLSTICRTLC